MFVLSTRSQQLAAALALSFLACLLTAGAARAEKPAFAPGQVVVRFDGQEEARAYELPAGVTVGEATDSLEANPGVAYAVPDLIAHAAAWPNDPGRTGVAGDWKLTQWNFRPPGATCGVSVEDGMSCGVDAPAAWTNLGQAGRGGAGGIRVAVVDTGIAFRDREPRYRRSPDFRWRQFTLARHDFVGNDRVPLDLNGHGTHVAGTIGERVNNGVALTGLAYNARIMPVRVLNAEGDGVASDIAAGIRFAADHGADVINMSFEFPDGTSAASIPQILEAIRHARDEGAVLVAAAGNKSNRFQVAYPARAANVIAAGGTTIRGCLANYSNSGSGLDLVAPGGGADDATASGDPTVSGSCNLLGGARPIFQLTFTQPDNYRRFGYPNDYAGTSMSAAHVSGVAALVMARLEGAAGRPATTEEQRALADDVKVRLKTTARDLGAVGPDSLYGAGLLDAAAATLNP